MSGPDALGIGDFKVQLDDEVASAVAAKVATRKWRAAWLPNRVAEQPSPLEPSGSTRRPTRCRGPRAPASPSALRCGSPEAAWPRATNARHHGHS
jgi:hypothetical protein